MLKIVCNKYKREALSKQFNVSPSTVSNAFNFKRFCQQHSEIRSYAVNFLKASVVEV